MSIFKRIFGKHKVMVFVPRRGGRKLLFTSYVSDVDKIEEAVLSELEKYSDDYDLKQYKYIIALDSKTNTEVKIDNPYFDEGMAVSEKLKNPKQDLKDAIELDLVDTVLNSYKSVIPQLVSAMSSTMVSTVKDTISQLVEQKQSTSQIRDLALLIGNLVELAKNWDKVKVMSGEIAPMIRMAMETGQIPKGLVGGKGDA